MINSRYFVRDRSDVPLLVNVYQAVRSDICASTYEEYWEGFRRLFAETDDPNTHPGASLLLGITSLVSNYMTQNSRMLFTMTLDKFLQVRAGLGDVRPQRRRGHFRVPGFARIQQFVVRLAGTMQVSSEDQM